MVHQVIYANPWPAATPVPADSPCCPVMLRREGRVPYGCTRERGHAGLHEAGSLSGIKYAEWSD